MMFAARFGQCVYFVSTLITLVSVSGCATTSQSSSAKFNQSAQQGVRALQQKKYVQARQYFSQGLRLDPKNCSLNTLNALSYQLQGQPNDVAKLELAQVGYNIAKTYCPKDPWPYYYNAVIAMQRKNYDLADQDFAKAAKLLPKNSSAVTSAYSAYLYSAYKSGDIKGGNDAIRHLKSLDPNSPLVLNLEGIYQNINQSSLRNAPTRKPKSRPEKLAPNQKTIVVDAVLILSIEQKSHSQGLNILNGLTTTYASQLISTDSNGANSTSFEQILSIPEITYDMNIFNSTAEQDQILARPTMLIKDGKEGVYFAGTDIYLGATSEDSTEFEKFNVGLKLTVKPTFEDDGTISMDATIERSVLRPVAADLTLSALSSAAEAARQTTSTSIISKINETSVISTLSEGLESEAYNKVPVLGRLPVFSLFSKGKILQNQHTTLLVLLTPRKPLTFYTSHTMPGEEATVDYYKGFISPVSNLKSVFRRARELDIYYVPQRLTPDLYNKKALNEAIYSQSYSVDLSAEVAQ